MFRTRYKNPVFIGDYGVLSKWAAEFIAFQYHKKIEEGGNFGLGSATGSSALLTYSALAELVRQKRFNPTDDNTRVVQLDNYVLPPLDPFGYDTEILKNVCDPLGLSKKSLYVPSGFGDHEKVGRGFTNLDRFLELNPVDVQLLGIGNNGHIAFLEPFISEDPESLNRFLERETGLVKLSESTLAANARFFDNDISRVPKEAATRGPKSILASKWNIVYVNNASKALAAYAALTAKVTTFVPASMLQLHSQTIWLIAKEAGDLFESWNEKQNTFRNLPRIELFETWHYHISKMSNFHNPRFE